MRQIATYFFGNVVLVTLISCGSFDSKVLEDSKYSSGREYETCKKVSPKLFRFDNYTFVAGYSNDSGNSTLGLYFKDKEILFQKSSDGFYDTVITANLNNDGVPDFLVIYCYEDGCELSALISKSKTAFANKRLRDDISEIYCSATRDTMQHLQPLLIKDINNDGKDEIIVNLAKFNNQLIANSCTDTVYADK